MWSLVSVVMILALLFRLWLLNYSVQGALFSLDDIGSKDDASYNYKKKPGFSLETTKSNQVNNNTWAEYYQVVVNEDFDLAEFHHFWKSTGFCPPDPHKEAYQFFLSDDMHQNLALIGSLPFQGIRQVRVHWLLDMVEMRLDDNSVFYNFTYLDHFLSILKKYDLTPGFELMGNPSQLFSDFGNVTQVFLWRDLITALAKHYIEKFGIEYVSQWNFETWNEPDHHDFDGLNFTVQGFKNYYDACSEGLAIASKKLRFGGPGGSCHIPGTGTSPICWELLRHCQSGKNFFTHKVGNRIDFISFHKKGNESSLLILEQEVDTIKYIQKHYPVLKYVPVYNDEADPLKTWSSPQEWRSDATYAAMVAKIIAQHIQYFYIGRTKEKLKKVNFNLLSNDNGFLSYHPYQFLQRTLLSRFQVNNTNPNYVQLIQKPVYGVMGLLSKLCTKLVKVGIIKHNGEDGDPVSGNFGIIATRCKSKRLEVAILVYNSADTKSDGNVAHVNLHMNSKSRKGSDIKWMLFEIDNEKTNPFAAWKKLGLPDFPSVHQFSHIKSYEAPHVVGPSSVNYTLPWQFKMKILQPGVSLIHLCSRSIAPVLIQNVQLLKISPNIVQITWKDTNRCILTYNVEYSIFLHGPFRKINDKKVVFPSYWHSCKDELCSIKGFYRVQAVDYWSQHGPYSIPVSF